MISQNRQNRDRGGGFFLSLAARILCCHISDRLISATRRSDHEPVPAYCVVIYRTDFLNTEKKIAPEKSVL